MRDRAGGHRRLAHRPRRPASTRTRARGSGGGGAGVRHLARLLPVRRAPGRSRRRPARDVDSPGAVVCPARSAGARCGPRPGRRIAAVRLRCGRRPGPVGAGAAPVRRRAVGRGRSGRSARRDSAGRRGRARGDAGRGVLRRTGGATGAGPAGPGAGGSAAVRAHRRHGRAPPRPAGSGRVRPDCRTVGSVAGHRPPARRRARSGRRRDRPGQRGRRRGGRGVRLGCARPRSSSPAARAGAGRARVDPVGRARRCHRSARGGQPVWAGVGGPAPGARAAGPARPGPRPRTAAAPACGTVRAEGRRRDRRLAPRRTGVARRERPGRTGSADRSGRPERLRQDHTRVPAGAIP